MAKAKKKKAKKAIKSQSIVKKCMKTYGTYVLEDRAVPDYRDGLKPVQRRILTTFDKYGYTHQKNFRKSADIVGKTMAELHPHGDSSIYNALVNMVNSHYPVIDGHGNWGNTLGDKAAANRYTECRLQKVARWIFDCNEVGEYIPNYSDELQEPLVIPSRLPMLLMNGNEGIGVGIRNCLPPFNIVEILNTLKMLIKTKNVKTKDIMKLMKAPDYGTGVLLSTKKEVFEVYKQGKGTLVYGSEYIIREDPKDDKIHELVITAFPPKFKRSKFIEVCKEMMDDGLIEHIYDGNKKEDLLVVGYKNSTILKKNILPALEVSVSYDFYVEERDKIDTKIFHSNLIGLMQKWIDYRKVMEIKYLKIQATKLNNKIAREDAILIAIKNITKIANALKKPDTEKIIKNQLKLNDFQVECIMKTTIGSLKKKNEADIKKRIKDLKVELKKIEYNIKHISKFIINLLDEIIKDFKDVKRGTKLKKKSVEIKGGEGGMYIISDGKNLRKLQKVTGSFKLSYITKDGEGATTISDHGIIGHWDLMDIFDGVIDSQYRPIISIIPYNKDKIVTLTNHGKMNVIANCQDKDTYKAVNLKSDEYVISAIGISEGDTVIFRSKKKIETYKYEDLEIQRNGIRGKLAIPRVVKDVEIFVTSKSDVLMRKGKEVKIKDLDDYSFYIVGKENYLDKKMVEQPQVVKFLHNKKPKILLKVM